MICERGVYSVVSLMHLLSLLFTPKQVSYTHHSFCFLTGQIIFLKFNSCFDVMLHYSSHLFYSTWMLSED